MGCQLSEQQARMGARPKRCPSHASPGLKPCGPLRKPHPRGVPHPPPQSHPKGTREQVLPAQPNGTFTIERAQVNQKPRDPQDRSNDFSLLFIYSDQ